MPARALVALALALHSLSGLRLDEAISLLQREGLPAVIYTSALVHPDMRVQQEPPVSASPRKRLEAILGPFGLRVVEGAHHELLVVPAPKPEREPPSSPPPRPHFSEEIVVMPSHVRIMNEPSGEESLSREDLNRIPNPVEDVARSVQILPGVEGNDVSATVNVRGSAADETVIALDGLELSEPFHLKDFFNIFSSLDSAAVARADLMTGGFPVEWGDRIGGVIDMSLLTPSNEENTISAGTMNGRLTTSGVSTDQKTKWLVSARAWYPDVILNLDTKPSELISTDCYDLLGKVEHRIGRTNLSFSFLGAYDNLSYRNEKSDELDRSAAEEDSVHLWLTANTDWSDALSVRNIVAVGRLSRDRTGSITRSDALQISDARSFNFVEVKEDWRATLPLLQQLKFGFDAKTTDARYDYTRESGNRTRVDTHLRPHEESLGLYVSDRVALSERVIVEGGVRWDRQSLGGHEELSPRISVLWAMTPDSDFRAGWGRYAQSQRLNELQVEDGVTTVASPETVQHRTISFEHRVNKKLSLRIEAFDKPMLHVRPRYENMLNPIDVFPEAQDDRVLVAPARSRAKGVELRLTGSATPGTSWWMAFAHSRAIDTIGGREVPRSWDEPNSVAGGFNTSLAGGWNAGVAATWHTGRPTTPINAEVLGDGTLRLVQGARNSGRLPTWFRADARLARSIAMRRGVLALSFDVINLTNHNNVCCITDVAAYLRSDGTPGVHREERSPVPIFPAFSAAWKF